MSAPITCCIAACGLLAPLFASAQATPARRWLGALRQESSIEGSPGRELSKPTVLAVASDSRIVVYDMGTFSVRAFHADGREAWSSGRKGSGPGEYQGASDIEPLGDGSVAVLDQEQSRLTILDSRGAVRRTSQLSHGGTSLVPLDDGAAFGITSHDRRLLWRAVYPDTRHGEASMPADISIDQPLIRSNFTAKAGPTGSVAAFMWSSRVLLLDAKGVVQRQWDSPELIPFPRTVTTGVSIPGMKNASVTRVDPKAVQGTSAIAATATRVFVLFGGATPERGKLIDVYELPAGNYLGTYRLPERATGIAALSNDRLVTLQDEPVPHLVVWRATAVRPSDAEADSAMQSIRIGVDAGESLKRAKVRN